MLWKPISEDVVMASVRRARMEARAELGSTVETVLDYMGDRQIEHLTGELYTRNPTAMNTSGVDSGQRIYPVPVPLLQRFVEEQATLFSKPVHWHYVDAEGKEGDAQKEASKVLRDHLAESGTNEAFEQIEKLSVALHPSPVGMWWQTLRGEIAPKVVLPHAIFPVSPDGAVIDEADQHSYDGFVVELGGKSDNPFMKGTESRCAFISGSETVLYEGEPDKVRRVEKTIAHTAEWDQWQDGKLKRLPLCPLTIWHWQRPLGELLPPPGTDLLTATIEVSMAVTMIFDHLRMQGFSIPFKTVNNPDNPGYIQKHGSRFPVVLQTGETFGYVSSGVPFEDLFSLPLSYVRLVALLRRMSSNDFSINGQSPASGFAKLVDSLPKLEARDRIKERWSRLIVRLAGPQITANLIALKLLSDAARSWKLRAKFADVTFPEAPAERNERLGFDLEHGLTTPARILAEREGISEEEAQERIEANRAAKAEMMGGDEMPEMDDGEDDDPLARIMGPTKRPPMKPKMQMRPGAKP